MPVILERIVMPRSRSRSLESMTRSMTASFSRKMPLCLSMASTSVVLPWSTCAMIAILRIFSFLFFMNHFNGIEPRRGPRRIQPGQHRSQPNERDRSGQQCERGMKLDRPAEALLINNVNQNEGEHKSEGEAKQVRHQAQEPRFEQNHAAHLRLGGAQITQQAELTAPVEHHGQQRIGGSEHGHRNG